MKRGSSYPKNFLRHSQRTQVFTENYPFFTGKASILVLEFLCPSLHSLENITVPPLLPNGPQQSPSERSTKSATFSVTDKFLEKY